MEIVINRTGRRFHLPVEIAEAFIDTGLAAQYVKPREVATQVLPTEPQFHIGTNPYSGGYQIICNLPNGTTLHYDGPSAGAADGFKTRTWDGATQSYVMAGPVPPAEVIAEYKALKDRAATRAAREAAENDAAVRAQARAAK